MGCLAVKNTSIMKSILPIVFICLVAVCPLQAQDKELPHFTKIIASPRISVILKKGEKESIRMATSHVDPVKVNVRVTGNTLRIYLDHARITEKQERIGHSRQSIYRDASVTAYITYRELKGLEIRGEEELSCGDEIVTPKLKLKAYGESEIRLSGLTTKKLKASLYGRNDLKILNGTALHQTFRSFGENRIDTKGMKSETASTRIYGEGRISVTTTDEIVINAFGEPEINVRGNGQVVKGILIGRVDINSRK